LNKESPVWTFYQEKELKEAKQSLPINGFDHMINLTNEGKLWKFPIDNEQGLYTYFIL
jgi:small subunit ribosomal protein S31